MTSIISFTHQCSFQNMFYDGFEDFLVLVQFHDFICDVLLRLFQGFRFFYIHLPFEIPSQESGQVWGTR